jgi:hypothetical protein
MDSSLYKCCFCLSTVKNPLVMCYQTHVGCFNCICQHLRHDVLSQHECPLCRQALHIRYDRLISETASTFHRSKRRKPSTVDPHEVFKKLLALKKKDKYRVFTRTLKRFANAAVSEEDLEQLDQDIQNIVSARISAQRLLDQKLYDPALYTNISI